MRSINKKQSLADLRQKIKLTNLSHDKSIQHYLWSRHRLNISSRSSCNDRYEGGGQESRKLCKSETQSTEDCFS